MLRRLAIAVVLTAAALVVAPGTAQANTPVVGQCHQLSDAITFALSDPTSPVSCGGAHNTLTVAVVESPVPLAGLSDVAIGHVMSQICYPAFWSALGGTPSQQHLSDFVLISFAPASDDRTAGQNWIRCDAALANGRSLAALPALGTPVIPQPLPRSMQRCETARKQLVPCSRAHVLRAVKAFQITGQPGSGTAILRQARRHCRGVVSVQWAPPEAWEVGDHWGVCFARSKR